MATTNDRTRSGIRDLQDRLTKLSEANLRTNEDLDYHSVLDEVTNGARALTDATYAATTVLDQANRLGSSSPPAWRRKNIVTCKVCRKAPNSFAI